MPRTLSILLCSSLLALTACASSVEQATYDVRTDTDAARSVYLFNALERVVKSQLMVAGYQEPNVRVSATGPTSATLAVETVDATMASAVERIATNAFSISFVLEDESVDTGADDRWVPTGIEGADLDWVTPIGNRESGTISIQLAFTGEGREKIQRVFRENPKRTLGIMVRGLLMSKITIPENGAVEDRIIITGVPSENAAEIFAADVNVGLHVTLTPAS